MEIIITSEKYLNAEPPVVTEQMIDWLLLTLYTTKLENWFKKIDKIEIRANRSYNGSGKIHFYIKINDGISEFINEEKIFHREFYEGSPLYRQNPPLGFDDEEIVHWFGKIERWQWTEHLVNRGVDCGEEGRKTAERFEQLKVEYKAKQELERIAEARANRYKQYLILKKEFEKTPFESE